MTIQSLRFVLAAGACLWATGCCDNVAEKAAKKAAEKAVEEATEGDASISLGDDVDVSALPAPFRYPGAKGKGRFSQNMPTGTGTAYILESADDQAKVKAHYASISGYKLVLKTDTGTTSLFHYETTTGNESYHVTVAPNGGKTGITIVHSKNTP